MARGLEHRAFNLQHIRLICNISGVFEVVPAFVWGVEVADIADGLPESVDGACADPAEMSLELGEGHFDGVEVWAVGGIDVTV